MTSIRSKGKKPPRRAKKTEHQVPVTEPVIQPTSETDPWIVPVARPEEPEAGPELPEPLAVDLLSPPAAEDEEAPVTGRPIHGRKLMWAGVLVCMAVIIGGWAWSFRYSLRLSPSPSSGPALADALDQFRTEAAALGQGINEVRAGISAAAAPSEKPASSPATGQLIEALKQKVTEAAGGR